MKRTIIAIVFCIATNYLSSQTLVKLALPDNCNTLHTNTQTLKAENDSKLEIFPNPNFGIFTLAVSFSANIEKAVITVYDIKGKSVYTETVFSNSANLVKQLNLSILTAGVYVFEVKNAMQVLSVKLVINK
jgi:hypothetical protein